MIIHIHTEKTETGWKAFIPGVPGAFVTSPSLKEAARLIRALALHVAAEDIIQGRQPADHSVVFIFQNQGEPDETAPKPDLIPMTPIADPTEK